MSFGYSFSDAVLLTQLAWKTVRNSRKACGEYGELTQQVSALHVVLRRLEKELRVDEDEGELDGPTLKSREKDSFKDKDSGNELQAIVGGCEKVLNTLDNILQKYNGMSEQERGGKTKMMWRKVRFGNGEMADLGDLRSKVVYYAALMTLFLNMRSTGSVGRVERQMNDAGGDLREIKSIVNSIAAAQISQGNHEGSILSAYTDDDRSAWKGLRRELRRKHGFRDADLRKHKAVIVEYMTELGSRGILDDREVERIEEKGGEEAEEGDGDKIKEKDGEEAEEKGREEAVVQKSFAPSDLLESLPMPEPHMPQKVESACAAETETPDTNEAQLIRELQFPVGIPTNGLWPCARTNLLRYEPQCQSFIQSPPLDAHSRAGLYQSLRDSLVQDVIFPLGEHDAENNPYYDREREAIRTAQRLLAKLEVAKENTTAGLDKLCDEFYGKISKGFINGILYPHLEKFDTQLVSEYSSTEKKIRLHLAALNNVKVGGSAVGLWIVHGELKSDLKTMLNVLSMIREGKKRWTWVDDAQGMMKHRSGQSPRRVLEINHLRHEITSHSVPGLQRILLARKRTALAKIGFHVSECVSCRCVTKQSFETVRLLCSHRMCRDCIHRLFVVAVRNVDYAPPRCCTDDAIPLQSCALNTDVLFHLMWKDTFLRDPLLCPLETCRTWIKGDTLCLMKNLDGTLAIQSTTCPKCNLEVCLSCGKEWHAIHQCSHRLNEDPKHHPIIAARIDA